VTALIISFQVTVENVGDVFWGHSVESSWQPMVKIWRS